MFLLLQFFRQSSRGHISAIRQSKLGARMLSSSKQDYLTLENLKNDTKMCQTSMESGKYVILHDRKYLVHQERINGKSKLVISSLDDLKDSKITNSVLLGVSNNEAFFAVSVDNATSFIETGKQLIEPRTALFVLSEKDQGIATMGLNLLQWQVDNKYCSKCKTELVYHVSGRSCRCSNCNVNYFPRYNPVVIMLVVCGEYCLLGRNKQFPSRMFSALAGFIDVGEHIEEAVVREVNEEVSVDVDISRVQYVKSDFWGGFRRNYSPELMIGCVATVGEMQEPVCSEEIAEAKWFHKEEIREALEKSKNPDNHLRGEGLTLPPPFATAHKLAARWCDQ